MKKEITCIVCPKGCIIAVEYTENGREQEIISVTGNTCDRGRNYAAKEVLHPERILTTTVKLTDGRLIPVRSRTSIPKEKMIEAMKAVFETEIKAPVRMGDTVIFDIASTGIDMIASCDMQ